MSLCDCYDYDPPAFLTTKDRTRRRGTGRCEECGHTIVPGERYRQITGKWDGEVQTMHQCERCAELSDALSEAGFCLAFGRLEYDYADYLALLDAPSPWEKAMDIMRRHREPR